MHHGEHGEHGGEVWQRPFVPTMEGQSIIKNLVLVGAALYLGGRVREEESKVAEKAGKV